ncbi:hypothetical protein J6590_019104 [Homalodisca vitripennis]|nr:hypothetical protein J6590_019104 [Homalodisca vitripennis]
MSQTPGIWRLRPYEVSSKTEIAYKPGKVRPPADRALTWALMGGRNSLICWRNPLMCGRNSLLTLLSYENVPNSVEIIVFFGKIGDLGCQNRCFSVKSVICWVLTLPVREKRGTEGIPIWRRGREKLAGTGEPNLTFLDGCAQLAGTGEHNLNCEIGGKGDFSSK